MSSQPTTYLITGANRGLGLGFVQHLASRPNTIIFATARDPTTATSLQALAESTSTAIHIIQLDVTSSPSAHAAAEKVKEIHPEGLDVVIANAGVADAGPVASTPTSQFTDLYAVNTLGPLHTFQAFYPLLKLRDSRKFFVMSTTVASFAHVDTFPYPCAAYGSSKAAVNYIMKCIAKEHKEEGFVVMSLCPGRVQTSGPKKGAITVDESVTGLLKVIDGATVEQTGRFFNHSGGEVEF
ncbi:hypothetical protein HK104_011211 [Borealophlyctis nickersoniae]|nr:hypothetical protein HK104_011211 [Borealophlyctis nickersoniae]